MWKAIVLAAAILSATDVRAETRLEVPDNASWKHAQTGIILRSKLAGFQRAALKDSGNAELDVAASYSGPERTWATVYVFRPALFSLPIWFDRSETAVLFRDAWKGSTPFGPPMVFAPPGSRVASGLSRIYVPGAESKVRSTAVAMMPSKGWLVAVRISSETMPPSALGATLSKFVQDIQLPADAQAIVAQPIGPCADTPKYDKRAKLVKPDLASTLLGAALLSAGKKRETVVAPSANPVSWCKQAATADFGVYRSIAAKDSYILALGDAGVVASVSPALVLDGRPAYQLSLAELDKTLFYPNFNRFPPPEKAYEALAKSSPVSSVSGGNK
jgi:hypothetical protein